MKTYSLFSINVILAVFFLCPRYSTQAKNVYIIRVKENGSYVNETIITHGALNMTEVYMPNHNGLERVHIQAYFNQNLVIYKFMDGNFCYVTHLQPGLFEQPQILNRIMPAVSQALWAQVPNMTNSYIIDGPTSELKKRKINKLSKICLDVPIYDVSVIKRSAMKSLRKNGRIWIAHQSFVRRMKRQLVGDIIIDDCRISNRKSACLLKSSWCHYIRTCNRLFDNSVKSEISDCSKQHEFGEAICCIACCDDKTEASDVTPYCASVTYQQLNCYDKQTGTWLKPKIIRTSNTTLKP